VSWTFGRNAVLPRDPRWDAYRGAGEDRTWVQLRAARVRIPGSDTAHPERSWRAPEHWVLMAPRRAGRDYNTTDLSENTLRRDLLPPFKAAVDAGVGSVMIAFNDLNGVPASANPSR